MLCKPLRPKQLSHLVDRFAGRVIDPTAAPAAFVRYRPDGQKCTKEEDAVEESTAGGDGVGAHVSGGAGTGVGAGSRADGRA